MPTATRPPREFQEAVLACPQMRSIDYLKAILANGPNGIVNVVPAE